MYLPSGLIPNDVDNISFDEFFYLYAMAEIAREIRIEDMKVATNKGIVSAYGEEE